MATLTVPSIALSVAVQAAGSSRLSVNLVSFARVDDPRQDDFQVASEKPIAIRRLYKHFQPGEDSAAVATEPTMVANRWLKPLQERYRTVSENAKSPNHDETPNRVGPATADQVREYLRDNPQFLGEFLQRHPEVLQQIDPPDSERIDGVVDLRQFLVDRLRGEVSRLKDQQRGIISASRANLTSQNRVHSAILFLLDAENFEQLIQAISTDLPVLLDLDVAALVVESNGQDSPHVHASGVRVVSQGFIDEQLQGHDVLLQGDIHGEESIFGGACGLVRSQALIRLEVSSETPPCLLALGSREPDAFMDGMRTELANFLARVLERCIRLWLDLAP